MSLLLWTSIRNATYLTRGRTQGSRVIEVAFAHAHEVVAIVNPFVEFRAIPSTRTEQSVPIYEYQCQACGYEFETIQKMSDPKLKDCPECEAAALVKKISAVAFRLKGSGWYETDFKSDNKRQLHEESGNGETKPVTSGDSDSKGKETTSDSSKSKSANTSNSDSSSQSATSA